MSLEFNINKFDLAREVITPVEELAVFEQRIILTETTLKNLEKIMYPLQEGRNLLLVGDVGVGKNALIYYINYLRNLPTIRFSFNQDTMPEDLVGSFQILSDGFHWSDGPLLEAMKKGYTFVADEMNLAAPEILKRFLSVFKNQNLSLLEKDAENVASHERFHFVATQNPSRGFEGRKSLPTQIQKLFTVLHIDKYPLSEEIEIMQTLFPSAPAFMVQRVVELQNALESKVWSGELARNSLEHFHFNIRSAQRFWSRVLKGLSEAQKGGKKSGRKIKLDDMLSSKDEENGFISNLFRFYVNPFPNMEDRESVLEIMQDVFDDSKKQLYDKYIEFAKRQERADFRAFISDQASAPQEQELDPLPITRSRLKILEEIEESLASEENLLLEGEESSRIGELIDILASSHAQKLTHVYLSKGMHTSEIIGSLRPEQKNYGEKIHWVDGPLTKAIKNQEWIVLENIEAAGSEIIEKLNMLLDDASRLLLPPEAEPETIVKKKGNTRIIAIKYFRKVRSQTTISRAFRNRFFSMVVPQIPDHELIQSAILLFYDLFTRKTSTDEPNSDEDFDKLLEKLVEFHKRMNIALISKKIDQNSPNPQLYQEENLLRWILHLRRWFGDPSLKSNQHGSFQDGIFRGAETHYLSALPHEKDREWARKLLRSILQDLPLESIQTKIADLASEKKKRLNQLPSQKERRKMTWDPQKHFREASTGKAKPRLSGPELKKGVRINTPETGGNTKEGEDAWYGRDTLGNKGVGMPQGGGGAWGYRTKEIFEEFLEKYKPKWDYQMGFQLKDYYDHFGSVLDQVELNLDNALETQSQIERRFSTHGHRIDMRKYLSYLAHKGSERIFDTSRLLQKEDQLKGLEVIFLINKGRRLFNFKYSTASIVALQSAIEMLGDHKVSFKVFGYSDLDNFKMGIDIVEYTQNLPLEPGDDFSESCKNEIFEKMAHDWGGDTVEEYLVLQKAVSLFSFESKKRITVMVSDFRGHRARQHLSDDILKRENQILKSLMKEYSRQDYVFMGVQTGPRNIAEHLFENYIWVNSENFSQAPVIFAEELQRLIMEII